MNINDYTAFRSRYETSSAIIVVANAEDAQKLLQFHSNQKAKHIRLSEGILPSETDFLPMPDSVMSRLRSEFNGSPVILTGLSPYLTLLADKQRDTLLTALKDWVDNEKLNVTVILSAQWKDSLKNVFAHPRYREANKLIDLQGEQSVYPTSNIKLVAQQWLEIKPPVYNTFIDYLQKSNDFLAENEEPLTIAMPLSKNLAGLNTSIDQIWTISDFMRSFYGVHEELSDSVLQFILNKAQELRTNSGLECLRTLYGNLTDVLRTALKRMTSFRSEDEASAMLWMLKQFVSPESYLYAVLLSQNCSAVNFLQHYIIDEAVNQIRSKNAGRFAEERRAALKEINANVVLSHIINFINVIKNAPLQYVAGWLDNGTKEEHAELIRRCRTDNIIDHIPSQIFSVYPVLEKYLAEFDYGSTELSDYFKRYRKQKVWNTVTKDFCKKAFDAVLPADIASRSSVLQPYFNDGKTALLVVDALGAEYQPLLMALAKDYNINAIKHWTTSVSLPSSTPFNKIEWKDDFRLPDFKLLDETVHKGAELLQSDYAENLVKVLDEIIPKIFVKITEALCRFDQVLLTADHGASRLAVLANDLNLSQTLQNPNAGLPADWRYCQKPHKGQCPPELTETLDGNYWVVRGYNRLPKPGGKRNELHGGATLEESLVPVILFTKGTAGQSVETLKKPVKQLIEKDDFDI